MLLNQIQAGVGTKEDIDFPLTATREALGPGVMMQPIMADYDEQLLVTIYCGTGTYAQDKQVAQRKIIGMLKRLEADAIICGPSYDYPEFSTMCAEVAFAVKEQTAIVPICAMAEEMQPVIAQYQDKITIVKMPKKGAAGLKTSLSHLAEILALLAKGQDLQKMTNYIYK
jgi:glycine reductase